MNIGPHQAVLFRSAGWYDRKISHLQRGFSTASLLVGARKSAEYRAERLGVSDSTHIPNPPLLSKAWRGHKSRTNGIPRQFGNAEGHRTTFRAVPQETCILLESLIFTHWDKEITVWQSH